MPFLCSNGGAGLASFVINDKNGDAFDRFMKFTKDDYTQILSLLSDKTIKVKREITITDPAGRATAEELVSGLGLEGLNVTVLQ